MLKGTRHQGSEEAGGTKLSSTARRCLVSGQELAKSRLIRYVVGPESLVVPDVDGRLPGRGLWVEADRKALEQALSKKLFARAAKANVKPCDDLLDLTERLLARRCLSLLGLARSAGIVVTGQPQVEHALSHGQLAYILLAHDAGRDCRKKLTHAKLASSGFSREELGLALGHAHLASVGIKPHTLAKKLEEECARWHGVKAADVIADNDLNDPRQDSERT
ncbi:MAG: DUF448 domain-containing protein [Alphaproteobacteria bacterium]|nr:DUF448 domain-containing protein [Alphaproteobacteria bacterium]